MSPTSARRRRGRTSASPRDAIALVRKQGDLKAVSPAEQHTAGEGRRAEPLADAVERAVHRGGRRLAERKRQLDGVVVRQVAEGDADQGDAALLDDRQGVVQQRSAGRQQDDGVGRRLVQRVRPGCPRQIVEPKTKRHRSCDAVRRAQATREPVDQRDQVDVELIGRPRAAGEGALGADRVPTLADLDASRVSVVRQGVQMAARSAPEDRDQLVLVEPRHIPTVVSDRSRSFLAVTAPTPHSRSTGSACRNASSSPTGTTSSPSGLATPLATFARNFVRARPTVTAIPTRSRTCVRSFAAMSLGLPEIRLRPPTSRNASSIERPSTNGVVSRKTSNMASLAWLYASIRGRTTTASGQSLRAWVSPIGV